MTTPIQHDYPDWGRQSAVADIIVAQHVNQNFAGTVTDPIKFVGQYPYVHVKARSSLAGMMINLAWYLDEAGTIQIGDDWTQSLATQEIEVAFPVLAPYLKVSTSLTAYPNTATNVVSMTAVPQVPYGGGNGVNYLLSQANGGPLAGGANVTLDASSVRGGEAYFEVDLLGATNFTAYLYAVDNFTGNVFLASSYAAVRAIRQRVFLPPLPARVQIFNQDAGAHDYRIFLHHKNIPI
jgi:hypothetical protein